MEFIAGSLSAIITRSIVAPIDTLKIRTQLSHPSKHLSDTLREISTEGKTALWKGNLSAMYLYVIYGGVQFYSLKYIRTFVSSSPLLGSSQDGIESLPLRSGSSS